MLGNDISNEMTPRFIFQWETLLARHVPRDPEARAFPFSGRRMGKEARLQREMQRYIDEFEFDSRMVAHIWDLQWRSKYSLDIITFLGDGEVKEMIRRRLDDASLPYANLLARPPEFFARELASMPHIYKIYFGDPALALYFGSRGEYVPDPTVFRIY